MFSDCLHRIFTRVLCGAQDFPWVMPFSNPDHPGVKEMLFTSLGEICSLFTRILNFRLSLGVFPGLDSTSGVLLLNEVISVFAGFPVITLLLFCFNRTMESVNGR